MFKFCCCWFVVVLAFVFVFEFTLLGGKCEAVEKHYEMSSPWNCSVYELMNKQPIIYKALVSISEAERF